MTRLVNISDLLIKQDRKIFLYVKKKGLKYTNKKSEVIYSSQEDFYPGGEEHPSTSVLGDIVKKRQIDYSHQQHRKCFPNRFDFAESYATKE